MELFPGLSDDVGLECLIRISHGNFSSVASVCRRWKDQIKLPEFWHRRKAADLTGKVVVMVQARFHLAQEHEAKNHLSAPIYRLTLCEPETGQWAELPAIPGNSDGRLPMFCQLVGIGQNLVVIGGWDPSTWQVLNSVFIYSFVSAKWRRGASMPGCRRSFFACASDSRRFVFVAGGHDGDKSALKTAMAYDLEKDLWVLLPDMERERDESVGIFHHGKFHVVGGYQTSMQGSFESSAESFHVASWQWGPVQENFLNDAICPRNCLANGDGGRLLVSCNGCVAAVRGSAWKVTAELPANVWNMCYMVAWGDKVLVIGSARIFGARHEMFVLDLKSSKWERVEGMDEFSGHVQSGCYIEL